MVTMRPYCTVMEIWRLKYWTHGPGHRKKDGRMERERKVKGREGNGKVENKKERRKGKEEGKGEGIGKGIGEGKEKVVRGGKGEKEERGRGWRRGKEKGKGKETRKEKEKGKGKWKEDSLRNVGRADARTDARTQR